jgi:hypothetical protein
MTDIRFLVEFADGTTEALDIPDCDLRTGDHYARAIAKERQREPIIYPRLKAGKIVRVYRDPKIAYL